MDALRALYGAWCKKVPFDNVRKMIHIRAANPAPLSGSMAEDYFEAWLKFGAGGTCWPGAGALHAFLASLGFDAVRCIGTMLVAPNLPPNHGTVIVKLDNELFLVDSSILHGEPLRLNKDSETAVAHPTWGVRCVPRDGHWYIQWRPTMKPEGFECRLDRFPATETEFRDSYERTRAWSPFNYELAVRINRGERVLGVAFGHSVSFHADGTVTKTQLTSSERRRLLLEDVGIAESLVMRLPDDVPTPPPPGSETALAEAAR